MSQEGVDVVRQKVRNRGRLHRTVDDWLTVLAPGLTRRIGALVFKLSPRSRLRRAFVARVSSSIHDAINRGDFELVIARLHPEVELVALGIMPPDLEEVYRGHEGAMRFLEGWVGAWDNYRVELDEVIDAGRGHEGTLVWVFRQRGRGKGSGVEIEAPRFQVITLRDALAIRVETFYDLGEALAKAGIPEGTITDPAVRADRGR